MDDLNLRIGLDTSQYEAGLAKVTQLSDQGLTKIAIDADKASRAVENVAKSYSQGAQAYMAGQRAFQNARFEADMAAVSAQVLANNYNQGARAYQANAQAFQQATNNIRVSAQGMQQFLVSSSGLFATLFTTAGQRVSELGRSMQAAIPGAQALDQALGKVGLSLGTLGSAALGGGIFGSMVLGIKQAADFEHAMADLRTEILLVEDSTQTADEQFTELGLSLRKLSVETGTATDELAKIAGQAGKLGIQGVEDIASFTESIVKLQRTTGVSAQQLVSSFGQIALQTGESTGNIEKFGSALLELSNTSRATSPAILEMTTNIGGAAKFLGLTTAQTMGLSAALASFGAQPMAVNRFLLGMADAARDNSGALNLMAQVAGKTREEFRQMIQGGAGAEAIALFFEGLKEQGEDATVVLKDLGLGSNLLARSFINAAGASGTLDKSISQVREKMGIATKSFEEGTKLADDFKTKTDDLIDSLKKLYVALKDTLQTAFEGALGPLKSLTVLLREFFEFVSKHPDIVKLAGTITVLAAGFIGVGLAVRGLIGILGSALTGFGLVFGAIEKILGTRFGLVIAEWFAKFVNAGGLIGIFTRLSAAVSTFAASLMAPGGLMAAFTALNAALGPVGWVVIGLTAVAGALVLVEAKTGLVSKAMEGLAAVTTDFVENSLRPFINALLDLAGETLKPAADGVNTFFENFRSGIAPAIDQADAFLRKWLGINAIMDLIGAKQAQAAESTKQAARDAQVAPTDSFRSMAFQGDPQQSPAVKAYKRQTDALSDIDKARLKSADEDARARYENEVALAEATMNALVDSGQKTEAERLRLQMDELDKEKAMLDRSFAIKRRLARADTQNQEEAMKAVEREAAKAYNGIAIKRIGLSAKTEALDRQDFASYAKFLTDSIQAAEDAAQKIADIRQDLDLQASEVGQTEYQRTRAGFQKQYIDSLKQIEEQKKFLVVGSNEYEAAVKAEAEAQDLFNKRIREFLTGSADKTEREMDAMSASLGKTREEAAKASQAILLYGTTYGKLTDAQKAEVDMAAVATESIRKNTEALRAATLARQLELAAMDLGIKGMEKSAAVRLGIEVAAIEKTQSDMDTLIKAYDTANNARQRQDEQTAQFYQNKAQYEGNYYQFSINALRRYAAQQDTIWQGIDRLIVNTMGNVQRSLSDTFFKYFTGETVKLKDVFKDLMHSMLRELANFLASATVKTFLNFMLNVLNGQGAGDAASNALGSLLGQRQGSGSSPGSGAGSLASGASGAGGVLGTLWNKLFGSTPTPTPTTTSPSDYTGEPITVGSTLGSSSPFGGGSGSMLNSGYLPANYSFMNPGTATNFYTPMDTSSFSTPSSFYTPSGSFLDSGGITTGSFLEYASGGRVPGMGSGDTVPAMLTPGEFVVRKDVAQHMGPMLEQMNRGGAPSVRGGVYMFATGGSVPGAGTVSTDALLQAILNAITKQTTVTQQVAQNTGQTSTTVDAMARESGVSSVPRWIGSSPTSPNASGDQELLSMLSLGTSGLKGAGGLASGAGFTGTANTLQALAGLITLYSGLKSGNALTAAGGGLQSASSLAMLLSNPAVAQALGLSPGFATGSGIVGQGLSAGQGVLGIIQGIQQGQPITAAAGGTQTLGSLANILSQPAVANALGYSASTANVLSGVGGGLGVVTGGLNIYQGIQSGSGSQVASGALSTLLGAYQVANAAGLVGGAGAGAGAGLASGGELALGAASEGAAAAAGAGATAGSAAISATTFTLGYIGAIAAVAIGMWQHEEALDAARKKQGILEGMEIRREYNAAVPKVIDAMNVLSLLPGLSGLPPDQQLARLQQIEGVLGQGWEGLKAVNHFIATKGVGTKQAISAIGRADTSKAEELANTATPLIVAGLAKVADAEALLTGGQSTPYLDFATLFTTANNMSGGDVTGRQGNFYGGRYAQQLSTTVPGNYSATLTSLLSANNPQFASSQFGQALNALPTFVGSPEQQMAALQTGMFNNQQASLSRMMALQGVGGTAWGGTTASNAAIIAAAPYTPGGWKALAPVAAHPVTADHQEQLLGWIPDAGLGNDLDYTLTYIRNQNAANDQAWEAYFGSGFGGMAQGGLVEPHMLGAGGSPFDTWQWRASHPMGRDSVRAVLTPGEFVVPAMTTAGNLGRLRSLVKTGKWNNDESRIAGPMPQVPRSTMGGGFGPVVVNITIHGDTNDPRQIAERLTPALRDELRRTESRLSRAGSKAQG